MLTMRRNSLSDIPVADAMSEISLRMRSTASASLAARRPSAVLAGHALQPVFVELATQIAVEEVLARNLVPLGKAQHLPTQRRQAPVEGVEVVDEVFDLGRVELH
jgi:hypothetical protein